MFTYLKKFDPELARLVATETKRQQETLDLIPSENIVSPAVLEALGSALTNKYSEGYPQKRYYAGNAVVDDVELLAQERARRVFRLSKNWHVNVQPYSGSPANLAVYVALLEPGEKLMGMSLPFGGHLTQGWKVSVTGKFYHSVQYGVRRDGYIDYDEIRKLARKEKPKIIIAGATAYPRIIDFKKFAKIAHEVNAYLMVDMAHIAGLVAAGAHPSPFPYADVVTTTTHKSLRGPRGAMIFSRKDKRFIPSLIPSPSKRGRDRVGEMSIASAIDKAVFPGFQGGPHLNQIAAVAVALKEAALPAFKKYATQVVKNAKIFAEELKTLGWRIVSGGTDSHLILMDTWLNGKGISGQEASNRLEAAGIIVNKNAIPFDTQPPMDPSGIRLGTAAETTRGRKEADMKKLAERIDKILRSVKHG